MKKLPVTTGDTWLISILLLISLLAILYSVFFIPEPETKAAQIRVDGQLVKILPLREGYWEEFRIGENHPYAIIETQNGKVRIRQDDSPRQIGVQTGWISHPQQQIVNLPYRIVITIVSDQPQEVDAIIR